MNAVSDSQTFGKALGALIRRKRIAAGLTQLQLSEDAFETPAKMRRISELEQGLVDNPQQKTIDPLIHALGITNEELEACAAEAPWVPDPELERAYREARNLIEAAAARFELARPEATLVELDEYLRDKAIEWRALRDRIRELDSTVGRIDALRARALAALAEGDLAEVDQLLGEAEDTQQRERTLAEVGKQSELRVIRGDAALLADDGDRAFEMYRGAARMFDWLAPEMAISLLTILAGKVYESARRTLIPRFDVARKLLDELAAHPVVVANSIQRAIADYRRSLIYNRQATVGGERFDRELLLQALTFARAAVDGIPIEQRPDLAVSARIQVGNVHLSLGRVEPDAAHVDEALAILRSALVLAEEEAPTLAPAIHNSIGSAHMTQVRRVGGEVDPAALNAALISFTAAMNGAEIHQEVDVWGTARLNRGLVFSALAAREPNDFERRFLRIRACAEFGAAIETYPAMMFHDRFAEANLALAECLAAQGSECEGPLVDQYLVRAINSFGAATSYYSRAGHPRKWAEIHSLVGSAFVRRASEANKLGEAWSHDAAQARSCFEAAAEALNSIGEFEAAERCEMAARNVEDVVTAAGNHAEHG